MNQNEENKSNMYNAVEAVFIGNASIVAEIPALGEVHTDLQSLIAEIETTDGELMKTTEGKISVKSKAIEELIASIVPIAAAARAYAVRKKLVELRAAVDYSENQLKHLTQVELPIKVKNIKDAAHAVLSDLASYGMTQAKFDLVDAKLTALKSASGKKNTGFTDHVAIRKTLSELFEKADDLLQSEADDIVEVLKESKLSFYNQYFAARVIKDLGGSHTKPNDEDKTPPPTDTQTPPVQ
ncbi:MAG: hypothetical protein WC209_02485 [Ignavibacteriaceae bacterium]|jgi:hypothetical protein